MAIQIHAFDADFRFERAFLSGKDRIFIDGTQVFEGKLVPGRSERISHDSRDYVIEKRAFGGIGGGFAIHISASVWGEDIGERLFNQNGQPVTEADARAAGRMQSIGNIGAIIGFVTMMTLNMTTGVVPGGAIGGAIGAGVGYALGALVGVLIYGRVKKP